MSIYIVSAAIINGGCRPSHWILYFSIFYEHSHHQNKIIADIEVENN